MYRILSVLQHILGREYHPSLLFVLLTQNVCSFNTNLDLLEKMVKASIETFSCLITALIRLRQEDLGLETSLGLKGCAGDPGQSQGRERVTLGGYAFKE